MREGVGRIPFAAHSINEACSFVFERFAAKANVGFYGQAATPFMFDKEAVGAEVSFPDVGGGGFICARCRCTFANSRIAAFWALSSLYASIDRFQSRDESMRSRCMSKS